MKLIVRCLFLLLAVLPLGQVQATDRPDNHIGIDDVAKILLKDELSTNLPALERINNVLSHLEKRQAKYRSEEDFVEYMYYYTHRKLLKTYTEYPTLEETLIEGNYDCLTATAVYAILLNELNVSHAVIETNYHIYILVHPNSEKELLIETTDPMHGFVKDQEEIDASKNNYLKNNLKARNTLVTFDFNLERKLEQKEIIGLLYYNQAIKHINEGNWQQASQFANMASIYYTEDRVSTLLSMIDNFSL